MGWQICPPSMTSENGQKIENTGQGEEVVPQENNAFEDSSEHSTEEAVDHKSSEGLDTESTQDEDLGYTSETDNLEKMILSTGIRVGTPVRTKYMAPFIVRANPEGLYILDISKTLARIDVAAKFIGRANISKVAVTSAREYGKIPVQKFCQLTGATGIFG